MDLSTPRASASADPRWKHDVFLSFRGEDTRKSITSELYEELQNRRGIKTFKDDKELQVGVAISPSLLMAIEESRFAIVVLLPNYASSPWCLDELTKICQCMEGKDTILPLFYHVDPSDVRHQKKSFEVAFTKHEEESRQSKDKVKQWRIALQKVANLSGWDLKNYGSDGELVKDIVEFVCSKVQPIEFKSISSTAGFEAFEATRQAMDEVMKALKEDEVTAIGVEGMGGVGKTTMVKCVAAQAQENGHFDHVIMAVVSQSPDLLKIQGTFADLLHLRLHEETLIGRAGKLRARIMRANRMLIILDDMWEEIDLSSIGIPNYSELQRCNSKLMLTTRRRNVSHVMRTQAKITLDILSEEDSWTLFVKNAAKSFQESTIFYDVARKVARECAGLPIALIAVSKSLGDKDIEEWKVAAQRLERSQTANFDDKGDVSKCIKLSYDYLRSDDAKSCFLLCCLFPEDEDIQIVDLMKYGFGKGLFQDANTIEEARGRTHSVVKYLKASSLLLDSTEDGCVRMHDVIRDTAISIALSEDGHGFLVKAGCELKEWPRGTHGGYSAISLMRNKTRKLPEKLVCSKLQILLLQTNYDIKGIPESFFPSPNALMVLDLSKTSISLLPKSLSLLTNLQALYLDSCKKIIDISILGNLKKLEILSMRKFPLKELPKEIGHLANLRMLDVTGGCVDTVPSKVISRLHRLEELYMQCDFGHWWSKVEGHSQKKKKVEGPEETNICFVELTSLEYLIILKVNISYAYFLPKSIELYPNWVNFNIGICRKSLAIQYHWVNLFLDDYSRTLTLDTTISTLPDWFIEVVTTKTEKLQYVECEGLCNILVEHERGRLHCLKYLTLFGPHKRLEELMNTTTLVLPNKSVFKNLEVLDVQVDYLKELCVGKLSTGSLCNLKVLKVEKCYSMVNAVISSNLLKRLQNLETLNCGFMIKLSYVFDTKGLEPDQLLLTNLRELILRDLWKLRKIWDGPAPHAVFCNLKILAFRYCHKLKNLLPRDVAQCLLQLEHLWVEECCGLDTVIEPSEQTEINMVIIPKLKDIVLRRLPQLSGFYRSATIDHVECPSLEHLYVDKCPQFSTPAASDFHSRNQVQVNDKEHFISLMRRESLAVKYVVAYLLSDDYSRTLTLDTTITTLPAWFIEAVTKKTEKLQYVEGKGLSDIVVEHDNGRLQCLKYLSVIGPTEELKVLMNTTTRVPPNEPVFENLEVLYVCVSCLKELCVGELPNGSLRNLKLLKVKGCDQMVNAVVPSNLLQRLHNLETLICDRMGGLKCVFGTEGLEPEQIVLTTLRQMILYGLWNLIKIWDGPAPRAIFRDLNFLAVYGCHKLKTLLTSDVAQCPLQLEHLWVQTSYGLERVIELPSGETETNMVLVLPKLKGIVLTYLPELTGFYSSTTGSSTIDHIECPSLEHLYVKDCSKFSTSASDFHSTNQVQLRPYKHFIPLSESIITSDTGIIKNGPSCSDQPMESSISQVDNHDELWS